MDLHKTEHHFFLLALLLLGFLFLNLLSLQLPFFWDNVLLSSQFAHFFYENGSSKFILSSEIDCGHPPFFGFYLSTCWQIFGKTLLVSHLSMLPFLLFIAFHYYKLIIYFIPRTYQLFAGLFVFLEPSVMAQCTMVSNDVVQLSGFVLGISALVYQKPLQLILGTLLLSMVSIRGAIIVFLLFAIHLILSRLRNNEWNLKWLIYFIPSFLFFLVWNFWHLKATGDILVGNNPKWTEHYETTNFKIIAKHIIVIIRNFLDFGRLFIWIGIIGLAFKFRNNYTPKAKQLLIIFTSTLVLFVLILLTQTNPIGHRYFLPFYLLTILLFFSLLPLQNKTNNESHSVSVKTKQLGLKGFLLITALGLFSGNFWIYPEKIAQGWDSTLAHLPYFKLRKKALTYIEQHNIPPQEIAAGFTMHRSSKYIELNDDWSALHPLTQIEKYNESQYLLYSNLINDFPDEVIDDLNNHWMLLEEWEERGVFIKLFIQKNKLN